MVATQDFILRTIPKDCHRVPARILGVPEWWTAQLVWVVYYFPFNLVQIESKIRHAIISG